MLLWNETISKKIKHFVYRRLRRLRKNKGFFVMRQDWDNLIILDACRYDMFAQVNRINGKLEYKKSRGSATGEFLIENFKGQKHYDTVYITGNPLVNYHVGSCFAKIVSVWEHDWNEEFGTVMPEAVVRAALQANREYPDKRLIIHFMQPHSPFIGKDSREKVGDHEGIIGRQLVLEQQDVKHKKRLIWNMLKQGKVDKKTVWDAYEENLRIVLDQVESLLKELGGKTIVSSDHGNLFAERVFPFFWLKEYGHPEYCTADNLLKVPWLVIEGEQRRQIKEAEGGAPCESVENVEIDDIKEKLEALGYL
ncbi:MAG: hypothetical protein ACYTFK_01235 [Planctomycetota bacterium]|jgi:hypothetical protein